MAMAASAISSGQLARWRKHPVEFIEQCLYDPETGQPFRLSQAQREFLSEALRRAPNGRLLYPELLFGAIKKSGKSTMASMLMLDIVIVQGGLFAEGYCCANSFEQTQGRVFAALVRIVEASPLIRRGVKITANRVEFTSTGSFIQAIPADYSGAAGTNAVCVVFDELWAYVGERSQRLFDEMVPPPTRQVACRLTVTYAGFSGESSLLEALHARGLKGREIAPSLYAQPGMLMAWHSGPIAPWQDQAWLDQMRQQLRPNAYLRMIENQFVTSESSFIEMDWWDSCVDDELSPALAEPSLAVWVGVDASVKRDSTAIVCCTFQDGRVRLVWHRVFQPSPDDPLDFENTIEKTLRELMRRFWVREIRYDPYQLVSVAQRLTNEGLPMIEFAQSVPNLTEASSNLYELIKGRNLRLSADDDMRLAASRAVALETSRGWRMAKEKASHKIDVIVALAQACLGATLGQGNDQWKLTLAPSTSWMQQQSRGDFRSGGPQLQDAMDDGDFGVSGVQFVRNTQRDKWRGY
jgi:phage terminase large subunit-like protein